MEFVTVALTGLGVRHDGLLDLVEDVNFFAALRLLQVCGVQRFGHIICYVPHPLIHDFAAAMDEAVASTLAAIQQDPVPRDSTHSLPDGAGGASLASLARDACGSYLGACLRVTRPMQQRLTAMGGKTNCTMVRSFLIPEPSTTHNLGRTSYVHHIPKSYFSSRPLRLRIILPRT